MNRYTPCVGLFLAMVTASAAGPSFASSAGMHQQGTSVTAFSSSRASLARLPQATQDFNVLPSSEQERRRLGRDFRRADFHPTGFYLKPGLGAEIFLEELPQGVKAQAIVGTYGFGSSGTQTESPRVHELQEGRNEFADEGGGVVWIRVSSSDTNLVGRVVKVTFGREQNLNWIPVFREGETSPASWRKELENAEMQGDRDPVLLVGKRVVLTAWRSDAIRYADEADAVLREYERILDWENQIAGIGQQPGDDRESPLRILVSQKNGGNPSASDYRISMSRPGEEILTAEGLRNSWTAWHEFGHMQQQSSWKPPFFTEVSVNIYPLAVQRALGRPSRAAAYDEAAHIFLDKDDPKAYADASLFVRLVMFEQLRIAFGERFLQDVHKEARANGNSSRNQEGPQQRKYFMVTASKAAGKDLTDFFVKWGWQPDEETSDAIAALNLTKPDRDPSSIHLKAADTRVESAVRGADRWITITGFAEPGSRLKTTNDPQSGWFDPEGGIVSAKTDGSFTVKTRRTINGQAAVKSFDAQTGAAISESNHLTIPE